MAALHKDNADPKTSSDTERIIEKTESPGSNEKLREEDGLENLNYPPPWNYEKWFPGGYSQSRMIKLKSPKNMYKAINLFAGTCFFRTEYRNP